MVCYTSSRLKALPVLNPGICSIKCIISRLICISEPLVHDGTDTVTIQIALDKLSEAELDKHTRPKDLTSVSEVKKYMASRQSESSEYLWDQQVDCMFLLATSEFAKSKGVPGVAFEFVTRTDQSVWTIRRIPDPGDLLTHPAHFERNELVLYSQRPSDLPISQRRKSVSYGFFGVGRAVTKIAGSIFA